MQRHRSETAPPVRRLVGLLLAAIALAGCSGGAKQTDQQVLDELKGSVNAARTAAYSSSTLTNAIGSRDDCLRSTFVRWQADLVPEGSEPGSVSMQKFVDELAKRGFRRSMTNDVQLARVEGWNNKKTGAQITINGRKDLPTISLVAQTRCATTTPGDLNFS
jgi:hypothetical protein